MKFTGVSSPDFDMKVMRGGNLRFQKKDSNGIDLEKDGERIIVPKSGIYCIDLSMDVCEINGAGSLRVQLEGKDISLCLVQFRRLGKQKASTSIYLDRGQVITVGQTSKIETTLRAGSVKIEMYKV